MKKFQLHIFLSLSIITSFAQAANIEVVYEALSPNYKNGKIEVKNEYVLLANATESKFYSPITEYIDLVNSTPEGAKKWQEMSRSSFFSGNLDKIPRKDGSYYVLKSANSNILKYYDNAGIDKYYYEETLEDLPWEISDSTKNILGYECIKAEIDFHGRHWIVWFSPEIPISNGPWKLGGLPGLILEATTNDGIFSFNATGLKLSSQEITPVYLANEYEKTNRKSFLKLKSAFLDNPLGSLNSQLGNGIKISKNSNDPIFKATDEIDLIETDYH